MPVEPALNPGLADFQMLSLTSDTMNQDNICAVRSSDLENLGKKMKALEYIWYVCNISQFSTWNI